MFNMADILMVNLLYWLTIAMGSQYGEDICRGWVLCNVACLLPLAVQFVKHDNYRTILLDHTVMRAFRAVGLHCLAFCLCRKSSATTSVSLRMVFFTVS